MNFRNADIKDLPIIVTIYNSTIESRMVTADTSPVSISEKENWFHDHHTNRPLWIVEDENSNIIGWVSFQDFYGRPAYNGTAEISIYLSEDMRGKGYGKKILSHCIQAASSLRITALLGFIFAHNAPSIKLFLDLGFEEWANLKEIASMDGAQYSLKILGRKV